VFQTKLGFSIFLLCGQVAFVAKNLILVEKPSNVNMFHTITLFTLYLGIETPRQQLNYMINNLMLVTPVEIALGMRIDQAVR
jgi:hypothetical protein